MKCPECRSVLVVVERDSIELDWCVDCRGLWFDEGELELLGEKAGRSLETEDLGRREGDTVERGQRKCPRCNRRMELVGLAVSDGDRIHIDRCPDHGFWLDQGELGRIMTERVPNRDSDAGVVLHFLGETFDAASPRPPQGGRKA